jgi:hypothetical protein
MHQNPGASHPRQKSISTTDSGMCRFFPSIWNVTARALTDRRAVLKGIAFAKSSNPSKTGRVRRRRECTSDIPSCDANNRAVVGPRRAPTATPPPTSFSSSPQCAGIAASIGQDLIFSRLGIVPRTDSRRKPHCGALIGVERLLSCLIAMTSFLRSDDGRATTLTAGGIRSRHRDPSPLGAARYQGQANKAITR